MNRDTVHPRAGGERVQTSWRVCHQSFDRFIPARAGNALPTLPNPICIDWPGSSPRGRGTHGERRLKGLPSDNLRFIPARAGNASPVITLIES